MAGATHLRVQVALFCDENDDLPEKLAQQQLSLRLFSGFTSAATLQLDLREPWTEVRLNNDGTDGEEVAPLSAAETKSTKGGAKGSARPGSAAGGRSVKLADGLRTQAVQFGARRIFFATVPVALSYQAEELHHKINIQPYFACTLLQTVQNGSGDPTTKPLQGHVMDVSPLLTAVSEVHAAFTTTNHVQGINQIALACSTSTGVDSTGAPLVSPSDAPTCAPIALVIEKVTKIPKELSGGCFVVAHMEVAGTARTLLAHAIIQSNQKCALMLQTVLLGKFMDAAELNEHLVSRSCRIEFHSCNEPVGVLSDEKLEQCAQLQDAAEADNYLIDSILADIRAQRTRRPFACADVRLAPLLSTSSYVQSAFGTLLQEQQQFVRSRLEDKASMLPCKAQFTKEGMKKLAMSAMEAEPQRIPPFLEANTTVLVTAQYIRPKETVTLPARAGFEIPLEEAEICNTTGLFARAVYVFRYDNDTLLRQILGVCTAVNSTALPNIQGTIRSYVLTPEEFEAAQSGELDLICGFTIIDDDCRIIVLEGLATMGMQQLYEAVQREQPNSPDQCQILANPVLRFARRMYTQCGPDLKRIRLRQPLKVLRERPDVYSSHRIDPACSSALTQLQKIKEADSLKQLQQYGLFPHFAALLKVESQYGQAISKRDMDGMTRSQSTSTLHSAAPSSVPANVNDKDSALRQRSTTTLHTATAPPAEFATGLSDGMSLLQTPRSRRNNQYRNPEYEEYLQAQRQQPPKDFLGEQRQLVESARRQYEAAKAARDVELQQTNEPVFMYSTQTLSSVEQEKARMRERLASQKNATFTYSARFTSQTISLVDATRIKQDTELASRAKWKTSSGFVYPAPRTREDLIAHPQRPDATRIEDLREPWEEPVTVAAPERFIPKPGQKNFDTVPSNTPLFGGYKAPRFIREYSRDDIGNPKRLPRGRMTLEKKEDFFKSVHLVGTQLAQEQQEALEREQELWQSKVVVDNLSFRVGGFQNRDRTLQLDRTADILHDPPMTKALKKVRDARLPSGKHVPLKPAPLGVLSAEPFVESTHFAESLRPADPDKFTATTPDGHPRDFIRYIGQSALDNLTC